MNRFALAVAASLLATAAVAADVATYPEDAMPLSWKKGPSGSKLTAAEVKQLKAGEIIWTLVDNADNPVKKGVAMGVIDAPPAKVYATIGDYENFKEFMPYVAKTAVDLRSAEKNTVSYWLEFPLGVGNRNYQLDLVDKVQTVDNVKVFTSEWTYTGKGNIVGTTGSWEIAPWGDGTKSIARYTVFTDPGGSFPTWMKNKAAGVALPKVVQAVRDRVKSPKAKAVDPSW